MCTRVQLHTFVGKHAFCLLVEIVQFGWTFDPCNVCVLNNAILFVLRVHSQVGAQCDAFVHYRFGFMFHYGSGCVRSLCLIHCNKSQQTLRSLGSYLKSKFEKVFIMNELKFRINVQIVYAVSLKYLKTHTDKTWKFYFQARILKIYRYLFHSRHCVDKQTFANEFVSVLGRLGR